MWLFFRACFQTVFSKASRHAFVRISASFFDVFRPHFRYVSGNKRKRDFHDPSHAKAMFYGFWTAVFPYFSVVFFTLRFRHAIMCDFDRFWVHCGLPFGPCGVTLHSFSASGFQSVFKVRFPYVSAPPRGSKSLWAV